MRLMIARNVQVHRRMTGNVSIGARARVKDIKQQSGSVPMLRQYGGKARLSS